MGKARTIKTVEDVAAHFGEYLENSDFGEDGLDQAGRLKRLNEKLSRRIYKSTECGAWGKVEVGQRKVGEREVEFTCVLECYHDGLHVHNLRPKHGRTLKTEEIPHDVRQYLCMSRVASDDSIDYPDVDFIHDITKEKCCTVTKIGIGKWRIGFKCKVGCFRPATYFLCGSIVEGCDAEVGGEPLYLPCSPQDIDDTVQYVEDETRQIWNDTHGCEKCNDDGEVGGNINPDCQACKGHGVCL